MTRGYLRYLVRNKELSGLRMVTLHNLAYIARLMADLRDAVLTDTLAERAAALRAGEPPRTGVL
jgi:queuine tRNA-ribosyltransferase